MPFALYHGKYFGAISSDMKTGQMHKSPFSPNPTKMDWLKSSIGQGLFEAEIGSWVLILVASKSIFGERSSFLHKNMKTDSFSFHSI